MRAHGRRASARSKNIDSDGGRCARRSPVIAPCGRFAPSVVDRCPRTAAGALCYRRRYHGHCILADRFVSRRLPLHRARRAAGGGARRRARARDARRGQSTAVRLDDLDQRHLDLRRHAAALLAGVPLARARSVHVSSRRSRPRSHLWRRRDRRAACALAARWRSLPADGVHRWRHDSAGQRRSRHPGVSAARPDHAHQAQAHQLGAAGAAVLLASPAPRDPQVARVAAGLRAHRAGHQRHRRRPRDHDRCSRSRRQRPARARPGRAERGAALVLHTRQERDGVGRGRLDRCGAVPADPAARPAAARAAGDLGAGAVPGRA